MSILNSFLVLDKCFKISGCQNKNLFNIILKIEYFGLSYFQFTSRNNINFLACINIKEKNEQLNKIVDL